MNDQTKDLTITQPATVAFAAPASVAQQRALGVVQMQMMVAQQFPRDRDRAKALILAECSRPALAEKAIYQFPRGATKVSGPSIHLLEVIAKHWRNLDYGFEVLDRQESQSWVSTWAWDMENNVRASRTIPVPHIRDRRDGHQKLTDERDIYELVANIAQRRVRSLLEEIIPGDVIDSAVFACAETNKKDADISPEGIKKLLAWWKEKYGVTQRDIERRFLVSLTGGSSPSDIAWAVVQLRASAAALRDGVATKDDLFPINGAPPEAPPPQASAPQASPTQGPVTPPPSAPASEAPPGPSVPPPAVSPPPTVEAPVTPPEAPHEGAPDTGLKQGFAHHVFDAWGEPASDLLTSAEAWMKIYAAVHADTPEELRKELHDHNADTLAIAEEILGRELEAEPEPVNVAMAIEIPTGRGGRPDWTQFLKRHVEVLAMTNASTFGPFYAAQQETIVRAPQSTRMAILSRYSTRAEELGLKLLPTVLIAPVNEAPPPNSGEAPIPEPTNSHVSASPSADPPVDTEALRAKGLMEGWAHIKNAMELEAYLNSTLNRTLLARWEKGRPELAKRVRDAYAQRRAELGTDYPPRGNGQAGSNGNGRPRGGDE